jgi:hypothetical protein
LIWTGKKAIVNNLRFLMPSYTMLRNFRAQEAGSDARQVGSDSGQASLMTEYCRNCDGSFSFEEPPLALGLMGSIC